MGRTDALRLGLWLGFLLGIVFVLAINLGMRWIGG